MNGKMNVTDSFSSAVSHAKRMMFRPFDFMKWLCLGVIVFLETLFSHGSGGSPRSPHSGGGTFNVAELVNEIEQWVTANLAILLPVTVMVVVVVIGLMILLAWLRSHGTMMFIRAVALDDARIGVNWRETRQPAFSLFLFRLVLAAAGFAVFIVMFVAAVGIVLGQAGLGIESFWPYVVSLLPIIVTSACLGLTFWLVGTLLRNFVAPLMYLLDSSCLDAWREFGTVCRGNVLILIAFVLIRFAYFVPFVLLTVLGGCCTCCIGFLPVIHHTLFSPFYVFDRAYSLYVIESMGPRYAIIEPAPPEAGAADTRSNT